MFGDDNVIDEMLSAAGRTREKTEKFLLRQQQQQQQQNEQQNSKTAKKSNDNAAQPTKTVENSSETDDHTSKEEEKSDVDEERAASELVIPEGIVNLRSGQLRVSLFDSLADPTWLTYTMTSSQVKYNSQYLPLF